MEPVVLEPIWLYRMCHIANLPDILARGMYACKHPMFKPPAVRIGDVELATFRDDYELRTPASGTIGEYVAFYFGAQSPMLYRIKTGWNVPQAHPQRDIVFILVRCADIIKTDSRYIVTDGQANQTLTKYYIEASGLDHVDRNAVNALDWKNSEEDRDRMRKKQAEFLVYGSVSRDLIAGIGVYDNECKEEVERMLKGVALDVPVKVDRKRKLYYP